MGELISVIVAIYNVEEYASTCIESIINQTYKEIEIILIDDGSTDNSGKICDTYAKKDTRIHVIHQKNMGLAEARRVGVNSSKGSYIGFVDGDDWIDTEMYEKLYQIAKEQNVDLVTSAGYRNYENGMAEGTLKDNMPEGLYDMEKNNLVVSNIFPTSYHNTYAMNGAVWNKFYKRDLVVAVINRMDRRITGFCEDNVMMTGIFLNAKKIYVQHKAYYHHRERIGSAVYSVNKRAYEQLNLGYLNMRMYVEESIHKEIVMPQLDEYMMVSLIRSLDYFYGVVDVMPSYVFPLDQIPIGAKIAIYGAGRVGRSYVRWIHTLKNYNVVTWVDKNSRSSKIYGISIEGIESLKKVHYDYLLIAILKEETALQIKEKLKEEKFFPEEKIIWIRPISFIEFFAKKDGDRLDEELQHRIIKK